MNLKNTIILAVLIVMAGIFGYAAQEETGICLPERHVAEQQNAKYCSCLDMGGYRYCKEDENGVKHWNYEAWRDDQAPTPSCEMSCKEDHCSCCTWQDENDKRRKRQVKITIPYDKY